MIQVNVGNSSSSVQGSGVSLTETREIEPFTSLEVRGSGTAKIVFGKEQSLLISADDNIMPFLSTRVEDGRLLIEPTESISTKTPMVFEIAVGKLDHIVAQGAIGIEFSDFDGETLTIELEGASRCEGSGKVANLDIKAAGATTISLQKLVAKSAKIKLSGAGTASVHATESFDGSADGIAKINCSGNPSTVAKSSSGIASISVD